MAGIYIHIPFCKKACHYCNFHFSTSLHRKPELISALLREIDSLGFPGKPDISPPIETIYFGGGTPSLLSERELDSLLTKIREQFNIAENTEITLEANPDDITADALTGWKMLGINRLSIGIQSFRQEDLSWMNRAHNATHALNCIELASAKGFNDLNIDLIYGTPTLDHDAWLSNLEIAGKSGVNHLSCYALTVEENTALHHFIKKGKLLSPPEEKQAEQFELLMDWAAGACWDHYEISNLCIPGHQSRHNSNYWSGKAYWGFGPSAHSFDGIKTRWNGIANNARYIDTWLNNNGTPYETEVLSAIEQLNEKIMTGLRKRTGIMVKEGDRTIEGLPVDEHSFAHWIKNVEKFENEGLCMLKEEQLFLTKKGKLFADHIASDLFF